MNCVYNTAKKCDNLCNNCPKNIKETSVFAKIVPAKNHHGINDYEGAILAKQENQENYD